MSEPDLFGGVLTDIANGPHTRGHGGVTEALVRRLHEKGLGLKEMGGPKIMARSESTMRKHAREFGLAFDDYVPRALRPKRIRASKRQLKRDFLAYYDALREANPEYLILLRMGDFYEAFGAPAKTVAGALALVVTARGKTPMCGIPVHSADGHLKRLAHLGHRVAICETADA